MNSKYSSRTANDERLEIKLPAAQKRRAFELASREGVSVGHLVRSALNALAASSVSVGERRNG